MQREYLYDRPGLPGSAGSSWLAGRERPSAQPLQGDQRVDIAVVGAGLVGTLTALRMSERGQRVALLEGRRAASDVTGHTSAKATAQHGMMARDLPERAAVPWVRANADAVVRLRELCARYAVPDAFEHADSILYVTHADGVDDLRRELALYRDAGLEAETVEQPDALPGISGAVRLAGQGRLDPVKLVDAALDHAPGTLSLYEGSIVRSVEESADGVKLTCDGGSVRAASAIIASHVPFFDTLVYSTRLFQYRTYAAEVAVRGAVPEGMWYTDDPPGLAWRALSSAVPGRLIVSGVNHKAGQGGDERERYAELFEACEGRFGEIDVARWWSTQDADSPDGLPLIGKMGGHERCFMASGFGGWGMSTSEVAAEVLEALVSGEQHDLADLLAPVRVSTEGLATLATENADFVAQAFKHEVSGPGRLEDVPLGEGRTMRTRDGHIAVMRDREGGVHRMNAHCTHMRCAVEFNEAEGTWDCPCHGSRFLGDGSWLHGPTRRGLERVEGDRS